MTPYEQIQKIVAHHISEDVCGFEITFHKTNGTSYHYCRPIESPPQPHIGDDLETDPDMETPAPAGPLGYHDEDFG